MGIYERLTRRPFLLGLQRGIRMGRKLERSELGIGLNSVSKKMAPGKFKDGYKQAIEDLDKKNFQGDHDFGDFGSEEGEY
jgi:hypothetical protein